jgi:hypothetical protein
MWIDNGVVVLDSTDGASEPTGHYTRDNAPRALLRRDMLWVQLTPSDLYRLIKSLETEALEAIEDGRSDYADFLLCRAAKLREACR